MQDKPIVQPTLRQGLAAMTPPALPMPVGTATLFARLAINAQTASVLELCGAPCLALNVCVGL